MDAESQGKPIGLEEGHGWAVLLDAGLPGAPVSDMTLAWWAKEFARHERPVVEAAVERLARSFSHQPGDIHVRQALAEATHDVIRPELGGETVSDSGEELLSLSEWGAKTPENARALDRMHELFRVPLPRSPREGSFRLQPHMVGCCVGTTMRYGPDGCATCGHGECKAPDHPAGCRRRSEKASA